MSEEQPAYGQFHQVLTATEREFERWALAIAERYCMGYNIVLAAQEIEAYLRQAYYRWPGDHPAEQKES